MNDAAQSIPKRLLVVMPSWVGDCVMATPACRALRRALPGAFIGALMRPGMDQVLAGLDVFDELHVDRAAGMMGPKRVASKLRLRRYDAAILFTNSFSTALITRLAGIRLRLGYDRDGRGLLLTDRLIPPKRRDVEPYKHSATNPGAWAPVPACQYYFELARHLLTTLELDAGAMGPLELIVTDTERRAASEILDRADAASSAKLAILNPGGNNPAKRWPPERFAQLADHLVVQRSMRILISGSPAEADLTRDIARRCAHQDRVIDLPNLEGVKIDLGALKGIIARCVLMVTNDTGPRHMAAALGVPVVTLFGPTDHRWTTIPFDREAILLADPALPAEEVANDLPERCAIEKIELERVAVGVDGLL